MKYIKIYDSEKRCIRCQGDRTDYTDGGSKVTCFSCSGTGHYTEEKEYE